MLNWNIKVIKTTGSHTSTSNCRKVARLVRDDTKYSLGRVVYMIYSGPFTYINNCFDFIVFRLV